jgi:lysophospholipase L1-like esterase
VRQQLAQTHVALLLLFPRPKDKGDDAPWSQVDVVNELLWESLRGSPGVSVVPCTRPFMKDGMVNLELLPDGIHPNGAGEKAIAGCLKKQMNRYLD